MCEESGERVARLAVARQLDKQAVYFRGMKPRSPKRVLTLTCHEAEGLRRLLLHILDLKVEQTDLSQPMATRIFDKIQDLHGLGRGHYNPKERERQGFRIRPGGLPRTAPTPAPSPPNDLEDVWGDIL